MEFLRAADKRDVCALLRESRETMTAGIRTLPGAVSALITLGMVGVAFWVGYRVADAGNSDGLLGIQEVLRGCAVAGVILTAATLVGDRLTRRFDAEMRRGIASALSIVGWVALALAVGWTLLLALAALVLSGGDEPLSFEDSLPDWAIFALPMLVASALLFVVAHRQSR
jgi:hypothetical protein